MPRIYTATSDPIDFCAKHMPDPIAAEQVFGDNGEQRDQGPDGRGNCYGYDAEHPDYDGEGYRCHVCRRNLTGRDN